MNPLEDRKKKTGSYFRFVGKEMDEETHLKLSQSINFLKPVLESGEKVPDLFLIQSINFTELHHFNEALECINKALEFDPNIECGAGIKTEIEEIIERIEGNEHRKL